MPPRQSPAAPRDFYFGSVLAALWWLVVWVVLVWALVALLWP
jgi:hypothetical protein